MLQLDRITSDNYQRALALKVRDDQRTFIAPVVKSLAQAYVYSEAEPRAAMQNEAMVGFVLLFPFEEDNGDRAVNIARLLIDPSHQGQGLGRALLEATLDWIARDWPDAKRVKLSVDPQNVAAIHLYKSAGFVEAGEEEGEVVYWLDR